jgi:hypothetical protein
MLAEWLGRRGCRVQLELLKPHFCASLKIYTDEIRFENAFEDSKHRHRHQRIRESTS